MQETDLIFHRWYVAHQRIQGAGGAAELLKLNPSTLASRMRKLGIKRQSAFR